MTRAKSGVYGSCALPPWRDSVRRAAGHVRQRSAVLSSALRKLSLLGFSEPIDLEPWHGFRARLYPAQNHTDKRCYLGQDFSGEADRRFMEPVAKSTPDEFFYFVDIGANSGCYSILAHLTAEKLGKKARILAIEANPLMLERLKFNLEASRVLDVEIIGKAVSDQKGIAQLDINVRNLGQANVVSGGAKRSNAIEVPTDTLFNIVANSGFPRIDFLKIDIEGHEMMALEPYINQASVDLFPSTILAETIQDGGNTVKTLLIDAGYTILSEEAVDTVFVFDNNKN
jgi:FkbM family methyltransferase